MLDVVLIGGLLAFVFLFGLSLIVIGSAGDRHG